MLAMLKSLQYLNSAMKFYKFIFFKRWSLNIQRVKVILSLCRHFMLIACSLNTHFLHVDKWASSLRSADSDLKQEETPFREYKSFENYVSDLIWYFKKKFLWTNVSCSEFSLTSMVYFKIGPSMQYNMIFIERANSFYTDKKVCLNRVSFIRVYAWVKEDSEDFRIDYN